MIDIEIRADADDLAGPHHRLEEGDLREGEARTCRLAGGAGEIGQDGVLGRRRDGGGRSSSRTADGRWRSHGECDEAIDSFPAWFRRFVDKNVLCNPFGVKMAASDGNIVQTSTADLTPTLARQVMEQLRRDILEGVHPPGSRLRIEGLRKRYGAGASPIREALASSRPRGWCCGWTREGSGLPPRTRRCSGT